MALFTDGPPSSIEDLSAQDSQLAAIANAEGIDVTQKLRLAHEELGVQLFSLLSTRGTVDPIPGLPARPNLATIAVTPPLKLWHTYRALEMFYADAYNSQLSDRYAGRRDQFHGLAQWSYEKLLLIGLGTVTLPVAQAASATAVAVPGGPLADGTYYATVAWVNRLGEEGGSAVPTSVAVTGGTISVSPGMTPANATGWNVYLGTDPCQMVRQNDTALEPGETWLQFAPPAMDGQKAGSGQEPNYFRPMPRLIQRG